MPLFLAIDSGGTKTRCLLADSTRILARASTGSIKLMRVSEVEATDRLQTMLHEVAASAQVSLADITRTCFGLAGFISLTGRTWARNTIAALVSGDLILCGDEEIALDAAFAGGPGILVIAGTGAIAIGRAPNGDLHRAGGWGPILGDEGSGFWIGLESIRAALRGQDRINLGGTSTCLLREIEQHWNLTSLADLVALANQRADAQRPAPDFASLAPVVARCAEQGDALALGVLERAGDELADLVTLVFHKMTAAAPAPKPGNSITSEGQRPEPYQTGVSPQEPDLTSTPRAESPADTPAARTTFQGSELHVAFTGSVLTHIASVRRAMVARVANSVPIAQVRESAVDPLEGALWRARQSPVRS
jgi:glucosamine kinase